MTQFETTMTAEGALGPGDFGFRVQRNLDENDEPTDGWRVSLPHQRDAWVIAGCGDWELPQHRAGHDEAVRLLKAFIAEAQVALAALEQRQEIK